MQAVGASLHVVIRKICGSKSFLGRGLNFPTEERNLSSVGNFLFQRWKTYFPPLEIFFSSLGKINFQAWNGFGKLTFQLGATAPLPHKDEESVSLADKCSG